MDRSRSLRPNDLPRLYGEYFYARSKWKIIGCTLGVSPDDLDAIDKDNRKCEDCFQELLYKWLREPGRKTESELVQAIRDAYSSLRFPSRLCIAIMILLSIVSAIPAVHVYRWFTANPLTTAAHSLKGVYGSKNYPVVEFELLDFTTKMPYINVTMEDDADHDTTVDFWELLNDLDSKHVQIQATSQDTGDLERILITGHPGVGKTTLMQYLAKEWANGRRLQSCKVLFLIQLGRLSKAKKPLESLTDLLQLSPYNDLDLEALSKEIKQRQGAGACFLLDSYDEWIWGKDFIHQLFFEFNLHSSLCIMTSRPYLYSKKSSIKYITMSGFKSANLEMYLKALSTAAHVLKGRYRHHPVVEFELLDFTDNMSYINVTMQSAGSQTTVNFWELLNYLDSKHMKLQSTEPGKLERILITGHPGAGKTTLMRYLAKEWANGRRLRSCKVLFLIQFGGLSKEKEPQTLIDLLQLSPYKDLDLEGLYKEIQHHQGAGACFLLDSYDEWIWEKDFVHKLFFKFNFYSSLSILTSRPHHRIKSKKQPDIMHIEMIGFEISDLEKHLIALSVDIQVTNSIVNLWNSKPHIKELCTLPLYMVMLMSIIKNGEGSSFNTRTEIYSAFMNVTVKHFSDHYPEDWNTISLWECILNASDSHEEKFCIAFTELHHIAYEMIFKGIDTFPDHPKVRKDINKLGFVKITEVASNGNQVRYTFHHPTFLEIFAAIHLLGLKQEKVLFLYLKNKRHYFLDYNPWLFYFGLIGAHYREDYMYVSAILKQLSMTWYQIAPQNNYCPPFCHNEVTFKYIEETGWTGKVLDALLESTGIVVNSTLYVDRDTQLEDMEYIINHATIHKLKIETAVVSCFGYFGLESSNLLYAQFKSVRSCLHASSSKIYLTISNSPQIQTCVNKFHCLLRGATNLQSLHIHLQFYEFDRLDSLNSMAKKSYRGSVDEKISLALNLLETLGQNLQTLSLTLGPLTCSGLSPYITFLQLITSKFQHIHNFKIDMLMMSSRDNKQVKCRAQLRLLFNEIALHKLQKIAITGIQEWISLDTLQDVLQKIFQLNKLKSLELAYEIRPYSGRRPTWYLSHLPHSLQELNLYNNDITDSDVKVIVQELKGLRDLRSLNLGRNSVQGGSLTSLVEALTLQQNFSSLDLSNNPINGNDGIKAIGDLKNLRHLKLADSGVNVTELVNILLLNNITLHSLSITGNGRHPEKSLLPLAQLTDLRHLDISEGRVYRIYGLEFDLLEAMLKNLTKLEFIKLCESSIANPNWNASLAGVISHHPNLRVVTASCFDSNIIW